MERKPFVEPEMKEVPRPESHPDEGRPGESGDGGQGEDDETRPAPPIGDAPEGRQ